ncbi:MAG: MlaA family lipoprotein [bacterium]
MNKNNTRIGVWFGLPVVLAMLMGGCATIEPEFADERDPWESFNRATFAFNEDLDEYLVKPVARGYRSVVPAPVDKGVTNFFGNLDDVGSSANNLLQGKWQAATSDAGRVLFNTTFGLGGVIAVTDYMDLPKHDEDFGQTLGYWGIEPGPYLVLPAFGPRTLRDTAGLAVDWYVTDPVIYLESTAARWSLYSLRFVDRRADLLDASDVLATAALDPYTFVREAYLQRRLNQVYDGNPPVLDLFDDNF